MAIRFAFACNNSRDLAGLRNAFCGMEEIKDPVFFSTGRELLQHVEANQTDAVLMDLILPDIDPFTLLERVWRLEPDARPNIFVMSAISDDRLLLSIRDRILYCFVKPIPYEVIAIRALQMLSALELEPMRQPTMMERLDRQIAQMICSLGVPAHLKGYYYLRDAVLIYVLSKDPMQLGITTDIYPMVAKLRGTQPVLVEHAMRSAIEVAWTRGNIDTIYKYFGYTVNDSKGKPSNLEFIAMLAEHVRRRYRIKN